MEIEIHDLKTFGELFVQKGVTFKSRCWLGETEMPLSQLSNLPLGDIVQLIADHKLVAVI